MSDNSGGDGEAGWRELLQPQWVASLAVLLGGILMHSMNVLMVVTVLPSIVGDIGGAALLSWPTTAFMASSIIVAACTGLVAARIGARAAYCSGAVIFSVGALVSALAPSMGVVIAGRFVQGFGGGLLSALVYVLIRNLFPARLWARAFAALASVWSVSVLLGPLLGGIFANQGNWRGAFYAVAVLAGLLAILAWYALPVRTAASGASASVPGGRVALIALAIVAMSVAAIVDAAAVRAGLIVLALAALALMLWVNRSAVSPLLPSDAFSVRSGTGLGLWIALLVSLAFSPLQIYGPVFLQTLHGLDPLSAGYGIAAASLAWTLAAVAVAGRAQAWAGRLLVAGPMAMAVGLVGAAILLPTGPVAAVVLTVVVVGIGIGSCWAFAVQRVMGSARAGEEDIAASGVATVQQVGFALGAAVSGLIANVAGLSSGLEHAGVLRAAMWLPASFTITAVVAALMGLQLARIRAARSG